MLQQIISHSWNTLAFKIHPNFNLANWEGHFFLSEWNAQFRFLARNKSFVSQIVNILLANYSAKTDKSGPQILDISIFFSFFAKKISYSWENKRSGFWAEWKGTSLWGCHILGRVHKNKFYGILTSCRGRRGQREGIHPICRSSHTLEDSLWRWTTLAIFLKAEASNKTEEDNLQFWR